MTAPLNRADGSQAMKAAKQPIGSSNARSK